MSQYNQLRLTPKYSMNALVITCMCLLCFCQRLHNCIILSINARYMHVHDLKSELKPTVFSGCYCLVCVSFCKYCSCCYAVLWSSDNCFTSCLFSLIFKLSVLSFLFGRIIHVVVLCFAKLFTLPGCYVVFSLLKFRSLNLLCPFMSSVSVFYMVFYMF